MTTSNFEKAFEQASRLVDDFRANERHYLSPAYQEQEARHDFIDKLLIALGWDVNHESQKNPFEQEVKVERSVSMQGSQRRADYAFYIAPNFRDVRFYIEAKKPHGDIATKDNYFQTIRYGWNSQTPIAVLTDFEQFHLLDCRYKPDIDTALNHSIEKFHYTDYADREKFARIFYLISREAVGNGSLENFTTTLVKPRGKAVQRGLFKGGYQSIDESFLEELDEHRTTLARDFKANNQELDGPALTEITQRTLDRLVFIRFLEDKLIEPDYLVAKFGERGTAWQDFIATSRRLDGIYNGIVFKKHDTLDGRNFQIDNESFADICEKLAHINSPYDFNTIPIHILGSIYERFLGKVIVTSDKRARIEQKPEVRKAGGVFYTPNYIVRYIAENTVGKLIAGKTPSQISDMRFADISCGSGSFLLGMYDLLLQYHRDYYNENPSKVKHEDCVEKDGALHLSLRKKREILLNNIYGVDIDAQAVEVAQLSLYLKLLEEETTATAREHQLEFHETLLPSLNRNIICGNSVIGSNILDGQLYPSEEELKLKPMDFQDRFPQIMKRGGFDAVIGNPPYVRIQTMQEWFPSSADYFKENYKSARSGNYDIYVVFVERGLSLLNNVGRLGFIMPQKFWQVQYGAALRGLLAEGHHVKRVVNFTHNQVFNEAFVNTCILILSKSPSKTFGYVEIAKAVKDNQLPEALATASESRLSDQTLTTGPWVLKSADKVALLEKLAKKGDPLEQCTTRIFQGLKTSADKIYVLELIEATAKVIRAHSPHLGKEVEIEKELCHTLIKGTEMRPYVALPAQRVILFPYLKVGDTVELIDPEELKRKYPKTWKYLKANEQYLREREDGAMDNNSWYGYGRTQALDVMPLPKLITPDLAPRSSFLLDPTGEFFILGGAAGGYGLLPRKGINPYYLLGLLNSRTLTFFVTMSGQQMESGYFSFEARFIRSTPIYSINPSNQNDMAQHDRIIHLVKQMIYARERVELEKTDKDRTYYRSKSESLQRQIDELVYELYGMTKSDIQRVEENARPEPSTASS